MWHCQPFVVYGNPGTLVQLKKLGYKTFSNFIDESYDNESCAVKRLELLVDSIKDFINKPTDELTKDLLPILHHNLAHAAKRSFTMDYEYVQKLRYHLNPEADNE